jgi:hypothetical protein
MAGEITPFDLQVRYQVYRFFCENGRAPEYAEIAGLLNAPVETVRGSFHELNARHLIFLEPGAEMIRMAHPFSAIPTRFRVSAGERRWWANCAWDSLGIAAAIHADMRITAQYPDSEETVEFQVLNGKLDGRNHVVHFPLPFHRWYDDLVYT